MNRKILDLPKCWSEEIKIIKQQYSLAKYSDEEKGNLSKYSWKKTVDKAKLQTKLESMRKEKSKIANIETFEKKEYLTKLKSEDARVAIKSRLMMLNLATNYKSGSHMTCCRKYSHLTNDFYTDDLFSSETVNRHKVTIAIKEHMQIRAQLLANHRASRNWRRETRNKKERNSLCSLVAHYTTPWRIYHGHVTWRKGIFTAVPTKQAQLPSNGKLMKVHTTMANNYTKNLCQ